MDAPTFATGLILFLQFGGLTLIGICAFWLKKWMGLVDKSLNAQATTINTQEQAIKSLAEIIKSQSEVLKNVESYVKIMETVNKSVNIEELNKQKAEYFKFVDVQKEAAIKQVADSQKGQIYLSVVLIRALVELVGKSIPLLPAEERKALIDTLSLPAELQVLKEALYQIAEYPDADIPTAAITASALRLVFVQKK